jgi:alpha-tubulin suppressor-like RCC1 family protein
MRRRSVRSPVQGQGLVRNRAWLKPFGRLSVLGAMDTTPALSEWLVLPSDHEDGAVYRWREEQFRELGFSRSTAVELAVSLADLAQARHLIASGCALGLAVRILS